MPSPRWHGWIWLYFPGNAAQIEPAFEIYKIEHSAHPESEPADAIRVVGADTLHLRAVDRFNAGDSVYCRNTSNYAGRAPEYFQPAWKLKFASGDGRESLDGGHDSIWIFEMPDIRSGEEHYLSLTLEPQGAGKGSTTSSNIFVACNKLPQIPKLSIPANPEPGRVCNFAIADPEKPGLRYRWQIIGDTVAESAVLKHTFNRSGVFGVQFLVRDTTSSGRLQRRHHFSIAGGKPQSDASIKTLVARRSYRTLELAWAAWLLLALLAVAAAWVLAAVAASTRSAPDAAIAPLANTHTDAGTGADRPPWPSRTATRRRRTRRPRTIPFCRHPAPAATIGRTPARRTDTLRATIMAGGCPEFRYRYRTRPSEYLFLVDEQMPGRHLARLFRHLAETLRGQDVVLDVVWYDAGFRRFWANTCRATWASTDCAGFPLSPAGTARYRTRPDRPAYEILAAVPVRHRSGAQVLATTPAADACPAHRLELARSPAVPPVRTISCRSAGHAGCRPVCRKQPGYRRHAPELPDWKAAQIDRRKHDARLDFQAWRSLNDHEAYLGNYPPMLRRWFLATAVSPEPGWELTLAIGRSIDAAGVTHEHLLALARIPALQEGRLHPGLRREMLKALDSDTERIARQAVLAELEAIQHLTADSHVAGDTAIAIAIQQFLLRPDKEAHRDALRALFENGALTRVRRPN
ncbi:MAG: hypothetical protein IPK76_10035 [Lewinellaceae bacterium]|nr:hypothetical protein [Lewinellaceae bacterium]